MQSGLSFHWNWQLYSICFYFAKLSTTSNNSCKSFICKKNGSTQPFRSLRNIQSFLDFFVLLYNLISFQYPFIFFRLLKNITPQARCRQIFYYKKKNCTCLQTLEYWDKLTNSKDLIKLPRSSLLVQLASKVRYWLNQVSHKSVQSSA